MWGEATASSLVLSRGEERERSLLEVELRRFSGGEGVQGVPRVTWHFPTPGPGAGCPLQGRPHLWQVRGGATTGAMAMVLEGLEEEEGEEGGEAEEGREAEEWAARASW